MSDITLPRAVGLNIRNSLRGIVNASDDDCGEEKCRECAPVRVVRKALAALDAALAEPEQKPEPDALRRWVNANDDAPETEFQRGYDAARRWVREVGLPALAEPKETFAESLFRRSWEAHRAALAEPKKERAEVAAPARSGVEGKIDTLTGGAYREHVTDGSPCWCNPELNYRDPETGAEVWVHRREQ